MGETYPVWTNCGVMGYYIPWGDWHASRIYSTTGPAGNNYVYVWSKKFQRNDADGRHIEDVAGRIARDGGVTICLDNYIRTDASINWALVKSDIRRKWDLHLGQQAVQNETTGTEPRRGYRGYRMDPIEEDGDAAEDGDTNYRTAPMTERMVEVYGDTAANMTQRLAQAHREADAYTEATRDAARRYATPHGTLREAVATTPIRYGNGNTMATNANGDAQQAAPVRTARQDLRTGEIHLTLAYPDTPPATTTGETTVTWGHPPGTRPNAGDAVPHGDHVPAREIYDRLNAMAGDPYPTVTPVPETPNQTTGPQDW